MSDDCEWMEIGWIEVDAGGVAFSRPDRGRSPRQQEQTVVDQSMAYQATMVDCPLPVEVRLGGDGLAMAARMCFTDDVDHIAGVWRSVGTLDLAAGRCLAEDPDCSGPQYCCELTMSPGEYVVAVFAHLEARTNDVLGLMITREDLATEEERANAPMV